MSDFAGENDELLVELAGARDQRAFAALFERYRGFVRRIALGVLRDAAEADDAVQEIFFYLFRNISRFDRRRGPARSWIARVALHRSADRRRYLLLRSFYNSVELEHAARIAGPDDLCGKGFRDLVQYVIREGLPLLNERQQTTLKLFVVEGMTLGEIAQAIGEPVGNVRHYYYRGLQKLRELLHRQKESSQ